MNEMHENGPCEKRRSNVEPKRNGWIWSDGQTYENSVPTVNLPDGLVGRETILLSSFVIVVGSIQSKHFACIEQHRTAFLSIVL